MSEFTITGRIVQGDPHKAGPPSKDPKTKQVKIGADGKPVPGQFFIAVAVPKTDPNWPTIKAALDADARTAWPQYFGTPLPGAPAVGPELPAGCTNPKFSNKITDGDGFDDKGVPHSSKEGFAGHWVVKMASQFAPKVWEWRNGWEETIHTGRVVKCGDYVSASGTTASNQSTESPGMYMNLGAVAFEREGPYIASATAIDPNAAFGARGAGNGAAAASPTPPAASAPPVSSTASPGSAAAPPPAYDGYMAPPPPVETPAGPVMLPAANGVAYAEYIKAGWTDDLLRSKGMMQ